ncbi:MAG: sigma-70 family RNA polymerase sigma factor [Myxococcota bacterium]
MVGAGEPNDVELLVRWREGDKTAGNALLQRHFVSVYRFFEANISEDVEDLTQRTFEACIVARDRLRDDANFRAYLFGIARKQLLRHLERRYPRGTTVSPSQVVIKDVRTSPSGAVARLDQQQLFVRGLSEIPLEFKSVLELFYWEDRKIPEIAVELGIAVGTVKSRLFRGKAVLKEYILNTDVPAELAQSTVDEIERRTSELGGDSGDASSS